MIALVKALGSLVLNPLLLPLPEDSAPAVVSNDHMSVVSDFALPSPQGISMTSLRADATERYSATSHGHDTAATDHRSILNRSTTIGGREDDSTSLTGDTNARCGGGGELLAAKKKYADEPALMWLRKVGFATTFGGVLVLSIISAVMLIFTHTAASNRGAGVHMVALGLFGFVCVWTATYLRVAWTKQSTDGVVHFMLIGTFLVDVGINLGSINYVPRPTEVSFLLGFALFLQAPHMPRYFAAIIALSLWCAYNDFALAAQWPTLTLPSPYVYDDFTIADSAIRIAGSLVTMLLVMFLLYVQSEENKRQIRTAESAVKVAAAVAERLGDYDTIGASAALRTGPNQHQRSGRFSVHTENEEASDVDNTQREGQIRRPFSVSPQMGPSDRTSQTSINARREQHEQSMSASEVEAIELDPKLLDAFQRLLVNLNAYRPYLPNWLLQRDEASCDDNQTETERDRHGTPICELASTSPQSQPSQLSQPSVTFGGLSRAARTSTSHTTHIQKSSMMLPVSRATFVAINFWVAPDTPSTSESDLATSQFIELVLKEANAAKAAVHYSALGEILLSWNVCRSDPAPEAKAARFLNEVQSCLQSALAEAQSHRTPSVKSVDWASSRATTRGGRRHHQHHPSPFLRSVVSDATDDTVLANFRRTSSALHLMRVAGAAVTGPIRTGEFGLHQKLRVEYASELRARLACLSKLAQQLLLSNDHPQNAAFDFEKTPMMSLLDAPTSAQTEHSFHIAHAGAVVVHSRRDAHKDAKASLLSSAEVPSTEQHQIFQLMGTRQSDDEWLYAMAEGAVDVWSDAWRKAYGRTFGDGESVHSTDELNASLPCVEDLPLTIAGLPEHCLVAIPDDAAAQIQGAVARVASMEGSAALRHSAATRALLDYVDRKLLVLYVGSSM